MVKNRESGQSEIIPRLYLKLLPIQIVLVIIGGINGILSESWLFT